LGIVGESGSGKSTLGLSIIQLLDAPGRVVNGQILFQGKDLTRIGDHEMRQVRGKHVGMIFQNPGSSLNPVLSVGYQLRETLQRHHTLSDEVATRRAQEALEAVGIADLQRVLRAFPFELSGGMQQRVMIALAMSCEPELLIADEPSTALDVTTQVQLLDRLDEMRKKTGTSIIFITHDIALLADFADVFMIMYAGQVCEMGQRKQVIEAPQHPYTKALLDSVARTDVPGNQRLAAIPGDPPDPSEVPPGCPFAPRCPRVMPICREANPGIMTLGAGHTVACHLLTAKPT
jgi:oligopeptide/dipeptide ABC transporter ATP-binding protein